MYLWIKSFHIGTVIFTGTFFLLRFYWMITKPTQLQRTWVKNLPVIIDTTLLASGITLAILTHQYPIPQPWLGAKITALLFYIGLGSFALKRGRNKTVRLWTGFAALAVFAYIVSTALRHSPNPLSITS